MLTVVVSDADELVIYVYVGECRLGTIEASNAAVIAPLLSRRLIRLQAIALLPLNFNQTKQKSRNETIGIFLNFFGQADTGNDIGTYLSDNSVFLQHPKFPEAGFLYKNPHLAEPHGIHGVPIVTENTLTGGVSRKAPDICIVPSGAGELLDVFDNVFKSAVLEEVCGDPSLCTELMRSLLPDISIFPTPTIYY